MEKKDRIKLGFNARILFENPAVIEAFSSIEANILREWRSTGIGASEKREKLYATLVGLDLFRRELQGYVKSEKLERKRIELEAEKRPPITPDY